VIVVDTNVLSEPLRQRPEPRVLAWLAQRPAVVITSVSVGEILAGVARLPEGKRRDALAAGVSASIDNTDEVLPYDEAAARVFASIQDARRKAGRPLSTEDGMIAAICISRGATLATRNTTDFEGLGLELIDPWR
jgi:predicted nucleic acid-binding protein